MKPFEDMTKDELIMVGHRVNFLIVQARDFAETSIGNEALLWAQRVIQLQLSKEKLSQCYEKLKKEK